MMDVEQLTVEGRHATGLQYIDDCYYKSTDPLPVVVSVRETPEQPRYAHGAAHHERLPGCDTWRRGAACRWASTWPACRRRPLIAACGCRQSGKLGVMLEGSPVEAATALLANLRTRRVL